MKPNTIRNLALVLGLAQCASLHAVTLTSTTHPNSVYDFFGASTNPFTAYTAAGGIPSGTELSVEDGALVLRNAYAGSFSVNTKMAPFDAMKQGNLYFDYKLAPDVKVNIFFHVNGVYHCAVFSGPSRVRPGAVLLGTIEGVRADGKWHRAHVPIRDWLRSLYPTAETLPTDEVVIGNWDNSGFLMAGFGGNGPGATWSLRNWSLVGTGPTEARIDVADAPAAASWALDDGKPSPLLGQAVSVQAGDGFHILHLRDRAGKDAGAYPFYAAASPPAAREPELQDNEVTVPIAASAGLDLKGLSLQLGNKTFTRTSPYLKWDGAAGKLDLDVAAAGFVWKNGEAVDYSLTGLQDLMGRGAPDKSGTLAVDFARLGAKPRLPRLHLATGGAQLNEGDFETGVDGWTSGESGGAIIERDAATSVSGKYSLRLTCPANAVPFRAWIRHDGFDASQYPIITFNYKVPPNLRVDFLLGYDSNSYSIHFTDKDAAPRRIGEVENVIADNKWHQGRIDIRNLLRAVNPGQATYKVDWFSIGDSGWLGNSRNTQYWIDDLYFAPHAASPTAAALTLDDVSGIAAASWSVSDTTDQVASTDPNPSGNKITIDGAGLRWVHARAQNGAGHWSDPAQFPVALDEPLTK